jgi:hypothetical protein
MKTYFLAAISCLILLPGLAHAFPEMVRHGYVNCTSCHVSPTGGGVLNLYGRTLSKEVLSTWGKDSEAPFAHGLIKTPEWLDIGGDFREAYLYANTPSFQEGRLIFMQADLEAAATWNKWSIASSIGYRSPLAGTTLSDYLISRRHYLIYRPTDEISFRVGRFLYAYGINMPDHTVIVRGGLAGARTGLRINDEGYETYNLEAAWVGEKNTTFVTGILGRPDSSDLKREQGIAVNSSIPIGESHKIGVSYLYGVNDDLKRQVFGPYGILGFSHHFFLLSEMDFQSANSRKLVAAPSTQGFANYNRLDYEWVQGFHTYLTQEFGRLDFARESSVVKSYGVGTQFFPRPHFEFNFTWQKQVIRAQGPDSQDVAYLLFHYYP